MNSSLSIRRLHGGDPGLKAHLGDLARLRIDVFRAFPYLYDGSLEYEYSYLETYTRCPESIIVLVMDGQRVVGATTGLPLDSETDEFQRPFIDGGYDPKKVFYCAESVLMPEYRGRGVYPRFFAEREDHARTLGRFETSAFCCVERPANHPLRPRDYQPLDSIWSRYGYTRHPELKTSYHWKDIDQDEDTEKPMVFWLKPIRGAQP